MGIAYVNGMKKPTRRGNAGLSGSETFSRADSPREGNISRRSAREADLHSRFNPSQIGFGILAPKNGAEQQLLEEPPDRSSTNARKQEEEK